jgi:hypothetical protein
LFDLVRTPRRRARAIGPTLVVGAFLLLSSGCTAGTGAGAATARATSTPAATATASAVPAAHASPPSASPTAATFEPSPTTTSATPAPTIGRAPFGYATRLLFPYLDVDLPIIEGRVDENGNPLFPLCDVAEYLAYYVQPGAAGTTYIYAHARPGMLLSMLEASEMPDQLLDQEIVVYTSDGWRHVYSVFEVKRHARDYSLADDVAPGEHRLIVQTSEGPPGDPNKLQVAARPVAVEAAPLDEVETSPEPRECGPAAD